MMRSTRFAKLISLVLTIAMVMTMLPLGALAETLTSVEEVTPVSDEKIESSTQTGEETKVEAPQAAAPMALGAALYAVTGGTTAASSVTMAVGDTETLSYSGTRLSNGSNTRTPSSYTWSASPSGIVSISGSGANRTATAVAAGQATVTVVAARNNYTSRTETFTITVTAPTPTISGSSTAVAGNTATLTANFTPTAWTSSDEAVATVSASGVVTAKTAGSTIITATDGIKTATMTFNVSAAAISGGNTAFTGTKLALTVNFSGAQWSSSDEAVATVDANGQVTALKAGTTTISATNGVATASTVVTVEAGIQISGGGKMFVGTTQQLTTNALAGETITWSSGNDNIASVDQTGLLSAVSAGQVTITATTENQGTATVTVLVEAYTVSLYSNYPDGAQKFTYDGQTGAGALVAAQNTYAVYQVAFNEDFAFSSDLSFTCVNYVFAKWTENIDGSGASYTAGDTLLIDKNVKLYAQWTPATVTQTEVSVSVSYYNASNVLVRTLTTAGTYNAVTGEVTFQVHKNEQVGAPYNSGALCGWTIGGENVDLGGMCTTASYTLNNGVYSVSATARYDTSVTHAEFYVLKRTVTDVSGDINAKENYYYVGMGTVNRSPNSATIDYKTDGTKTVDEYIVTSPSMSSIANILGINLDEAQSVRWYKIINTSTGWHIDGMLYTMGRYWNINYYDNGVLVKTEQILDGSGFNIVGNAPTPSGEGFINWVLSDGSTVSSGNINVSANTDVYAKYTKSYGYTINYFVDGVQDNTLTVHGTALYDSKITSYPDKCPTGYQLDKATLLDGSNFNSATNPLVITDTAASNVLNVYYVPNEFKISYAYTGTVPTGALSLLPGEVLNVPAGTAKIVAGNPALIGYTFSGWTTADADVATDGSFTMPYKNVTFTGSWTAQQFDVTYALSSDSARPAGVTLPAASAKEFGANVAVAAALNIPGYTFTGWTTSDATVSGGSFTMPNQNVSFVGKLTANTNTAYKIEYYLETVAGGAYQKADEVAKTGTTDATVTASGADIKTFPGFSYNASNANNVLGGVVKADGSLVLKLYYDRDEYTVTYRIDGTLPVGFTDNSATLGGSYAYDKQGIAVAAVPQVAGYTFNGWNSTDVSVTGGTFTMPNKNVTFTGSFTAAASNYTIEYYLQNLEGTDYVHQTTSDEVRSANTDTTVTVLASDIKSFPGFSHNGTFDTGVVKADGSLKLAVYYTRGSHDVTYALSNDSATPDGVILPTGSTEKLGASVTVADALNIPGYTFTGWTTTDATVANGSFTMPNNNVAFVGKLTANTDTAYTIEYYLETVAGGSYEKANADLAKTGTTDATVTVSGTDVKTFSGFTYDASNAENVLSGVVKADGSLVLKLYYTRNDYTVTYRLTDDSLIPVGYNAANLPTGGSYAFETANIAVAGTDKMQITGYTFHGWDSNDATVASGSFTMPAGNVVFTGYYTANDNTAYTIEYYLETMIGGSFEKNSTVTKYATTNTQATVGADDVKSFAGFTYNAKNTNNVLTGTVTGDGNLVLKLYYERNDYTVTYQLTGTLPTGYVDNSAALGGTYAYDTKNIAVAAVPTAAGYTFSGWTTGDATVNGDKYDMPANNVVFTGSFTAQPSAYKVTYYLENVEKTAFVHDAARDVALTGTTDTTATATGYNSSIPGFTFDSGNANNVLTGRINGQGTLELKLYYTRNTHTVSYEVTGTLPAAYQATMLPAEATAAFGKTNIAVAAVLSIPGYTFSGWTTTDANVANGSFTMPDQDVKFTATFTVQPSAYTIEYYLENVTGTGYDHQTADDATRSAATDSTATVLNADIRTYTGFTHDGNFASGTVTADGKLTLKVYYTRNTYTINYLDSMDATKNYGSETLRSGAAIAGIAAPTKTGYTFAGWNPVVPATMPVGGVDVYAQWTINNHTVSYQVTGVQPTGMSGIPDGGSYDYNTEITVAGSMTAPGYTFSGWTTDDATVANGKFTMPDEDVVLTGSFTAGTATSYTIKYYLENLAGNGYDYQTGADKTKTGTTDTTGAVAASDIKTFAGFTHNGTFESGNIAGDGSLVLSVYYTRNSYKLTYKIVGSYFADASYDEATYRFGAPLTAVAKPEKTGYTFHGWTPTVPTVMPAADTVIEGYYTVNRYKLTYKDSMDPNGEPIATKDYDFNAAVTAITDPTKTGYTFTGWTPTVPANMPAEDVTVFANWTINRYAVRYELTEASVIPLGFDKTTDLPETLSYDYNTANVAVANGYTIAGYTFSGWTTTDATVDQGKFTVPANDVVFKGSFSANTNTRYTVRSYFETLDGSFATVTADDKVKNGTTDTQGSVEAADYITRQGFVFDSTNANNVLTGTITGDGALVLSVYYKRTTANVTYAISGDAPAGVTAPNGMTNVKFGTEVAVAQQPTVPAGYTFNGWTTSDVTPANGIFRMPTSNVAFTGVWALIPYTITYVLNGSTANPAVNNAKNPAGYNVETGAITFDAPTRTGYTFGGWYTDSQLTTAITGIPAGNVGNVTVYAKWTADTGFGVSGYTGSYDGQNHSVAFDGTRLVNGDVVEYKGAGETAFGTTKPTYRDVGTYTVNVRVMRDGREIWADDATVTINTVEITVNMKDLTVTYGTNVSAMQPTFTAPRAVIGTEVPGVSITGLIDTTVVTNAVPDVNTYSDAIVAAAGAKLVDNGTFLAKNYTLKIVSADLIVTPAGTMTVSAANVTKVYDANAYGVSATSNVADAQILYYNDATGAYDLTTSPVIKNVADSVKTVKFTAIHPNYTQVYGQASVTITPATITVNMNDLTAVYGDQKSAMQPGYTAPGAVVAGEAPKVEMTAEIASTVANRPNAGKYTDVVVAGSGAKLVDNGSFLAGNYTLAVIPADLTVQPRAITITANESSKNYGAAEPQHTAAVTAGMILNNELTYTVTRPSAGTTENPGVYGNAIQVTVTNNPNSNYDVTTVNAKMTINVQVSYAYDGVQPSGAPALPETFYVAPGGAANTGAALALTGYSFNGWNSTNVTIAADGSFTAPRNENVVLTGTFEAGRIRYQVQYHWQNTDGLTYANDPASMLFADADSDVTVVPSANTAAFTFNAVKSNVSGNVGRANDTLVLHLYYDRVSYTVSYLLDGVAYKTAQSYLNGKTVTTLAAPTETGKVFSGWNSADIAGTAATYLPGTDFTMPASNVTLTGALTWVNHTLSFDTDGAQTATPAAQTLHYGDRATNVTDPVKAGHDFLYWTDGTNNYQSNALATGFTMPDADVVLKAVWQVHYHTLTYMLDGTQLKFFAAVPYGASLTSGTYATSVVSDRINTFSGWTVDNSGAAAPDAMPDEDLVLVGEMTPVIYFVRFWVSGGTYGATTRYKTDEYTVGEPVGGHKAVQLEGYTFSGWSEYPATMPDRNVDVYGSYSPIAVPTPDPTPTPVPTPEPEPSDDPIIERVIEDDPALAGPANLAWALVNLILAIVTAAASIVLLIGYIGKKKNEKNGKDIKKKGWTRFFSLIPGIGAIVAFILTENMANPMRLVDRWTILMAVIALIQLVVCFVAKRKEEDPQEVQNV